MSVFLYFVCRFVGKAKVKLNKKAGSRERQQPRANTGPLEAGGESPQEEEEEESKWPRPLGAEVKSKGSRIRSERKRKASAVNSPKWGGGGGLLFATARGLEEAASGSTFAWTGCLCVCVGGVCRLSCGLVCPRIYLHTRTFKILLGYQF